MSQFIVFAYSLKEGAEQRVAVAIFPSELTTVLIGGGETWVHYTNGETWHNFQAELGTLNYLDGQEARAYAETLRSGLIDEGTIAGSPLPRTTLQPHATPPRTPLKFPQG